MLTSNLKSLTTSYRPNVLFSLLADTISLDVHLPTKHSTPLYCQGNHRPSLMASDSHMVPHQSSS